MRLSDGTFAKVFECIATRNPQMAILGLAAVWGGRDRQLFHFVNNSLPPINVWVAAWTGSMRSFLDTGCSGPQDQYGSRVPTERYREKWPRMKDTRKWCGCGRQWISSSKQGIGEFTFRCAYPAEVCC